jgi:hypothetical protein
LPTRKLDDENKCRNPQGVIVVTLRPLLVPATLVVKRLIKINILEEILVAEV